MQLSFRTFLLVSLLFLSALVKADFHAFNFSLETIGVEDGLPQSTVRAMTQDIDGFIYFATDDGVSRFDGISHKQISLDSVSERRLFSFSQVCTRKEHVWASSFDGGILYFNNLTESKTEFYLKDIFPEQHTNPVIGCALGAKDHLWFALRGGIFSVRLENELVLKDAVWMSNSSMPDVKINQILVNNNEQVYVATTQGIKTVLGGSYFDLPVNKPFQRNIKQIYFDQKNRIWALGDNHVYVLKMLNQQWQLSTFPLLEQLNKKLKSEQTSTLLKVNSSQYWIATQTNGVWVLDESAKKIVHLSKRGQPFTITDNKVVSVMQSHDGTVWLGTWLSGANKLRFPYPGLSAIREFTTSNGEAFEPSVRAIFKSSNGTYWIGTDEEGIFTTKNFSQRFGHFIQSPTADNGLVSNSIRVFYERANGELWIGTENGIVKYQSENSGKKFMRLSSTNQITGRRIRALLEDSNHTMWIGSYDRGLSFWDESKQMFMPVMLFNHIDPPLVTTLVLDSRNKLWVGTDNFGVFVIDPTNKVVLQHFEEGENARLGTPNNFIWSIFQEDDETYWLGSYGKGIGRYNVTSKIFTHFTSEQGLPNNVIYSILKDRHGWMWSSTNKGLARYNNKANAFTQYTRIHGLPHNEFNSGAYFQDPDGQLYFGSLAGLVVIEPDKFLRNVQNNRVFLNQLVFNDQSAFSHEYYQVEGAPHMPIKVVAKAAFEKIKMVFSSSDFFSANEQAFAYRLIGIDSDWNFSYGDRLIAFYNQLPPGKYRMEVKQKSASGIWSQEPLSFELILSPPWWATTWAYLAYILIIASGIGLIYWYWVFTQKRNEQVMLRLNKLVEQRTQLLKAKNEELLDVNQKLIKANQRLEEVSMTDALTGMGNRRMLFHYLERDLGDIKRAHASLNEDFSNLVAVQERDILFFMIDIDFFKEVNDQYGHAVGDKVLLQVSNIIGQVIREGDYVIRYGGEEFLLVLRNSPRTQANIVADRLLRAFAEYSFEIDSGKTISLTCSIGFVPMPFSNFCFEQFSPEQVIQVADHCLYCAKASGRNCWVGMYGNYINSSVSLKEIHDDPMSLYKKSQIQLLASIDLNKLNWTTSVDY